MSASWLACPSASHACPVPSASAIHAPSSAVDARILRLKLMRSLCGASSPSSNGFSRMRMAQSPSVVQTRKADRLVTGEWMLGAIASKVFDKVAASFCRKLSAGSSLCRADRSCACRLPAKRLRCRAEVFAKQARHVTLTGKAHFERDFRKRQSAVCKQSHRMTQAAADDVLAHGQARRNFEAATEGERVHADLRRDVFPLELGVQVVMHEAKHLPQHMARERWVDG